MKRVRLLFSCNCGVASYVDLDNPDRSVPSDKCQPDGIVGNSPELLEHLSLYKVLFEAKPTLDIIHRRISLVPKFLHRQIFYMALAVGIAASRNVSDKTIVCICET